MATGSVETKREWAGNDSPPTVQVHVPFVPNATVFVSSACIMVVELAAGRLVSRYLGQSLYTWTTIIGVMLAGISLGNYLGGRLADRSFSPRVLALQFLMAAAGCLSVLVTNTWAGEWGLLAGLSWPARIFWHTAAVFLIPSFFLGTISPVIAKWALSRGVGTGRIVGKVYAWALAGSIGGTVLAGFYLPVRMGVRATILSVAGVLGSVAVVYGAAAILGKASRKDEGGRMKDEDAAPAVSLNGQIPSSSFILHPSSFMLQPLAAVFLANACIMIIEIVAGRILSRYFGQSLYTWTTVIGVVLGGMTLGGYGGGWLADRYSLGKMLSFLLLTASMWCLCIARLNKFLIAQMVLDSFSWPTHIFIHTSALFFVPSVLLGAVTPVVVKMALVQGRATGKTIGMVYAWGSVGSIVGTFLAGFYLIMALGSFGVLGAVSLVLVLVAVFCGRQFHSGGGRNPAGLFVGIVWIGVWGLVFGVWGLGEKADGAILYEKESAYSYIAIKKNLKSPDLRDMVLDQLVHSTVDLARPLDLKYEYEQLYAALIDMQHDPREPVSLLMIGGGGYVFPHYIEITRPKSYIEVVEIDPEVTEAAHQAFGFPRDSSVSVFTMDARNRVTELVRAKKGEKGGKGGKGEKGERPVRTFDYFFGDTFNDYSVPYQLTTVEFTRDVHALLSEEGVYAFNMIDLFDSGLFLGRVIATCRAVFPYVYVFNTGQPTSGRDTFIVVSSKKELRTEAGGGIEGIPAANRLKYPSYAGVLLTQASLDGLVARSNGAILTDDYAPVENLLAPVVRTRRKDPGQLCLDRARHLYAEGDLDGAIERYTEVLRIHPDWPDAYESLGLAYLQKGEAAPAIEAFQKAVALDPRLAQAYYNMGLAYAYTKDFERACEAWRKVLAIDPAHGDANHNLLTALYGMKKYDEAWARVKEWQTRGGTIDPALLEALRKEIRN